MDRPLKIRSAQGANQESDALNGHSLVLELPSQHPVRSGQHASGTETALVNRSRKQILIKKKNKVSKGHFFKNTVARDNARVQYGDTYNYGTCKRNCLELEKRQEKHQTVVKLAEAQVRATIVAVLLLNILENFFKYVLSTIPKPIVSRVSVLEDAFGRTWRIDIDTISTWPEFESLLVHKFEKTRGLQRVKKGKYRLQSSMDKQLINPRHLPKFAMVFKPGTKVRMSIYFSWDEVRHTGCPRCMTEQPSFPGTETVCSTCGFSYTAESQEAPEEFSFDRSSPVARKVEAWLQGSKVPALSATEYRPSAEDLDKPENFNRVSIGAATRRDVDNVSEGSQSDFAPTDRTPSLLREYYDHKGDIRIYRYRLIDLDSWYETQRMEREILRDRGDPVDPTDAEFEFVYSSRREHLLSELKATETGAQALEVQCREAGLEIPTTNPLQSPDSRDIADSNILTRRRHRAGSDLLFEMPLPLPDSETRQQTLKGVSRVDEWLRDVSSSSSREELVDGTAVNSSGYVALEA